LYAKKESAVHGEITIAVDQALRPLVEAELNAFMGVHLGAHIHPVYLPGEEAINYMLTHDSVRLVISTRRLTIAETKVLRERLITPDYSVFARDGVAVMSHPDNPVQSLTLAQLRGVLTGTITRWRDIDPQAPAGNIRLVFDHPQSSTLRYLRDSLLRDVPLTQQDVYSQQSTVELIRYVAETPQALGFGSWAWLSDRDDPTVDSLRQRIRLLALERPAEAPDCVEPGTFFGPYQGLLAQGCYPLVRNVTTIRRESVYGLGAGLIAYLVGPKGQRIAHKSGLAAMKGIPREIRLPAKPRTEPNDASE
jgi:phosphate transport system substrate-binding protein